MKDIQACPLIGDLKWVKALSCLILIVAIITPVYSAGNEDNSKKLPADLVVDYYKNFKGERTLIATLIARENGQIRYIEGQSVALYLNELTETGILGRVITDQNGRGELRLSGEQFKSITGNVPEFTVIAVLDNSEAYISENDSKTIMESVLEVQCFEEDSVKYVKAVLNTFDADLNLIPAEDIEIQFYIQRMLGLLSIGGDYTFTDENGEIIIEFPDDLSGSRDGKIDIIVKIEDDEYYGNISYKTSKSWGVPLKYVHGSKDRSLWGSRANAPVFLIVISNFIILGVWIIIIYMVIQIIRIRKLNNRKIN